MRTASIPSNESLLPYLILAEITNMILFRMYVRRTKQVQYLADMINRNGGVTDEFDKIALRELGLEIKVKLVEDE